jgi:hypothetical protein
MFLGLGPDFEFDLKSFASEMEKHDTLDVVLRCTIHIENQLIKAMTQALENPAALKSMKLDYSGRVALCEALGLPTDVARMASAVGAVRNKLAHKLDYVFDNEKVGALEATAEGLGAQGLEQAHRDLKAIKNDRGFQAFDRSVPLDRFKIFAFVTVVGIGAWQVRLAEDKQKPAGLSLGGSVQTIV